ncbi:winged helix-turn-helix transcriptional regulator [Streptosporangium sp. NPDC002721]|uniref:winged helix-turn-helix transcriptional regulator n=1 Tax=Streptosporangium sp. NPDC002721 TaxID=3366188 RepID=UPI0036846CEC
MEEGTSKSPSRCWDTGDAYVDAHQWDTREDCEVRQILDRVADKWSLLVIALLDSRTLRFTELSREIDGVSQRMLTVTLRHLERDGLVRRTVHPVVPPRVDYELTPLGVTLHDTIQSLVSWTERHQNEIAAARADYDARTVAASAAPPVTASAAAPVAASAAPPVTASAAAPVAVSAAPPVSAPVAVSVAASAAPPVAASVAPPVTATGAVPSSRTGHEAPSVTPPRDETGPTAPLRNETPPTTPPRNETARTASPRNETGPAAPPRNETRAPVPPRDGTRGAAPTSAREEDRSGAESSRCEVCGGPIRVARTGRPARFCGTACRQKAHRHRSRATLRASG